MWTTSGSLYAKTTIEITFDISAQHHTYPELQTSPPYRGVQLLLFPSKCKSTKIEFFFFVKTEISNFRTKFHTGKPPRYIKCYHRKEASSLWQQPQSNYFPNVIREHTCFFTSKVVSKLPTGRYFVTRIIIKAIGGGPGSIFRFSCF